MKKKPTPRKKQVKENNSLTPRRLAEILHSIPEIGEAYSTAELELLQDDAGWIGAYQAAQGFKTWDSKKVQKARYLFGSDPMAAQAVNVWVNYAIGKGVTYEVEAKSTQQNEADPVTPPAEPKAPDVEALPTPPEQLLLDRFFSFRKNRSLLSSNGQQKLAKQLLVDGDLFFAVFDTDPKTVRRIDPLQICELICDPNDEEITLGYKRDMGAGKTALYYRDWTLGTEATTGLKDKAGNLVVWEKDVVIYHIPFNTLGKRGCSLFATIIDWNLEYRRFMQARVQLLAALNKIVYNLKVKGGQTAVNRVKNSLTSSLRDQGLLGGTEKNPPAIAGSTYIGNDGAVLESLPRLSGAGDAKSDGDQLKLQQCAGTGVFLHYFGDPSTGNLATATAMELPMLKMFGSFQELWKDSWRDIFSIVLDEEVDAAPEQLATIDIHMPTVLSDDLTKIATFITALTTAFPEAKVPEVLRMMLNSLGIQNVDEVMETIAANKVIVDQQKLDLQNQQMEILKSRPAAPGDQAKVAESLNELLELLKVTA